MANYVYPAIGLIGGTAGFLDAIDGTNLADKDMAVVSVQGDKTYFYVLDADSAAAEASPGIIAPDANGGDKRWLLVGFTPVPAATGFTIAGGTTSKTLTVSGDATVGQSWTTPSFDAGNFTASESMTWTVEAGDVETFRYIIVGKTMIVTFRLADTSVGGTPSTQLLIAIPGGKTAASDAYTLTIYNQGSWVNGICAVFTAGTNIVLAVDASFATNWAAAPTVTHVRGTITFEIQ